MELVEQEKSKFSLIDEEEFMLARKLAANLFNSNHSPATTVHVDTTLAQQLKKTYPTENELDHLLKKPTAKQVYIFLCINI